MARLTLRFYAGLFLLTGLLFVAQERLVLGAISWAGSWAGLAPLPLSGPSLWLGLAGSLMCVIAWLSFRLSENPRQDAAWEALLLSKAISSSLFAVFCARTGNLLFLASACVDGFILLHLAFLRGLCAPGPGLAPRLANPADFYEVWFARLNDPVSGRALWVRYSLLKRGAGTEAACWATFFDPAQGRVISRRWKGAAAVDLPGWIFRMGDSGISLGVIEGSGEGVAWKLHWKPGPCPPVAVVAPWIGALGLSSSGYDSAAPQASFEGSAVIDGQAWGFSGAFGCVGHVWGKRYGAGWWWAHAVFPNKSGGETVFEILSAAGPLGLRVTSAFLWKDGRLHRACGPLSLLRNGAQRQDDLWRFSARFGALSVEGECSLGLAATLEYEGPDGRKLACRNSKVSAMRLRIIDKAKTEELSTEAAAMEFVS